MYYEQFKERIEEDLHQALADHGIDANLSQHHVEKLNASYDAISVTPEGSHSGGQSHRCECKSQCHVRGNREWLGLQRGSVQSI